METPKNLLGSNPKAQIAQHSVNSGETDTWKLVVSFIIGALVGALGVWVSADEKNAEDMKSGSTQNQEQMEVGSENGSQSELSSEVTFSSSSNQTGDMVAEIAVDNQKAGDKVVLKQAKDTGVFWVAIHEDRAGMPGNVLGASRFESGMHLGEVSLLRPTVAGNTYHAMMHRDDGDRIFDIKKDVPVTGGDGKPVMASFKAE